MSRGEPMQRRTVVRGMVKEAQDHEVALRAAKRAARRSWFALPVVPRMR